MDINAKSAVVTGGGSGIGRAMCLALARNGASVVVADLNETGAAETVALVIAAGGDACACRCDVTRTEDLAAAIATARERFGRFDILCNNAGISTSADLFDDDPEDWRKVIEIDLDAVIDGTRMAVRELRRSGGGVVVNTASMGGLLPMPTNPVYAAAKAGVVNFTRSLAYLAEERIRVNAICPTFTDTPLVRRAGDERVEEMKVQVGGILQPEDIAEGLIELLEDESRAGAIMRVTVRGGRDYAREIRP